jgi:hypothetical protein
MERTRISKQPRLRRQVCPYRIELNVSNDILPFLRRPNPPIERLVLPETLASSGKQCIRLLRRNSFDILRDPWRRRFRLDQDMDMIRHHDKCDEVVPPPNTFSLPNSSRDALGDQGSFEPVGTKGRTFQLTVGYREGPAVAAEAQGERAVQPERYEERRTVRLKVGKFAPVFHKTVVPKKAGKSQFSHRLKPVLPGD